MPRKVFISFLGTSNYRPCTYTKDGQLFGPTRFIQEATLDYLISIDEWTTDDRVLILLTPQAESKNWVDSFAQEKGQDIPLQVEGLSSRLLRFPVIVETITGLPEGVNEAEIWTIFSRIYDYIKDGDILYFDLTHGYRYLPMLILVLGNYTKFLKGIQIRSITYGNWEISQGGSLPAPIIDLMPLSTLQDWTFAAGQFIENGNANQLYELSRQEYIPLLSASLGTDIGARNLRSFVESLKQLVDDSRACRALSVIDGKSTKRMKEAYRTIPDTIRPYIPLFQKVEESFQSFSPDYDPLNGFRAAKWCLDKELYQQAATYLEESVIYTCCRYYELNPLDKDHLKLLSGAFDYAVSKKAKVEKNYSNYSEAIIETGKRILQDYEPIVSPFTDLREKIRNDFNHAGIRKNPLPYATLIKLLNKEASIILDFFLGSSPIHKYSPDKHVLINLSNHPSRFWSDTQLKAAEQYGRIIDIEFPEIDPAIGEEDLETLVHSLLQNYLGLDPTICTFHIMGEMTLTFLIVTELKALGFKCLASTSKRNVRYNDAGEKIVVFDFSSFREY